MTACRFKALLQASQPQSGDVYFAMMSGHVKRVYLRR